RGIDELAEDVRQHGILNPLLVRPVNGSYEILAGHRRYQAAERAGLDTAPVRILQVSDEQALEIQIVDNLQRENVHPMDEALGFKALLEQPGYTPEVVAAKVGKSVSYVQRRLKVADLSKPAQKAFLDGVLTVGHAELIARLQPADQERALKQ